MGVNGLWPILAPSARPTPLPTLNRKRLAVDASIWIYQFLKAVRDKEGNALRNSHVVGFFRRICKLLFFGIKPVFVFDGGAPALKRQTVLARKQRREGRRDDAVRTAGRLLAVQMKKRGEEEEEKRKRDKEREKAGFTNNFDEEEPLPAAEDMVYVGEMGMNAAERVSKRKFHKKDAYHLPEIPNLAEMGQPNDPRIMSAEQLEEYARQFHSGEDVNLYDFSKIDFNGEFFMSLPAGDRYNILNAARLRSRLRMGLSKEQLEEMFPDRMAFSKFQIERVRERNELTQRLMNLNGMTGDDLIGVGSGRIAGEQGREYVLVKNDGVEGGYALGVVSTEKGVGDRNKPIDVDAYHQKVNEQELEESEDEFEDVPVEGLNRLPKIREASGQNMTYADYREREISDQKRKGLSKSKSVFSTNQESSVAKIPFEEPDGLFVDDGDYHDLPSLRVDEEEELNRAIAMSLQEDGGPEAELDEEEHLNRAIELSLQKNHHIESDSDTEDFEDVPMPLYEQRAVTEPKPLVNAPGSAIAHIVNSRANAAVPKRRATSISSGSESEIDLQSALAKARKQKTPAKKSFVPMVANTKNPFDGPLPFEKLDFGKSLFGKKSTLPPIQGEEEDKDEDDLAGGFELSGEEPPRPLPPWLINNGDIRSDIEEQQKMDREINAQDRERALEEELMFRKEHGPITIESEDDSDIEILEEPPAKKARIGSIEETEETTIAVLPSPTTEIINATKGNDTSIASQSPEGDLLQKSDVETLSAEVDEEIAWSESEYGDAAGAPSAADATPKVDEQAEAIPDSTAKPRSASPEFEDVVMPQSNTVEQKVSPLLDLPNLTDPESPIESNPAHTALTEQERAEIDAEFDEFSDPEDEELLAQLAVEAEEHARFASTLNNKSERENQEAYERELKGLRSQQKKDRRDADEVSHIMITECQALLRLFGLPYITAPMEAEAQCAELVRLNLVDGIVTDDSDIFLFGGTRVYKNMFNSNKYVECYLASDLEKELSLSRNQLISIAHLLGSDYTDGLTGVGPVTAIEILSEFPSQNGLDEFKEWWSSVQLSSAPLTSEISTFRKKFRRSQAAKLFLPPAFPSHAVTEAYLKPEVDRTTEPFQWGVPDLDKLREFLMATIGWTQERTDEVLVPVIRDMNRREAEGTQTNITRFFDGAVGAGVNTGKDGRPVGSKRMSAAVSKLKAKKGAMIDGNSETFAESAKEWARKNDVGWTEKEQAKAAKKSKGGKGKKNIAEPVEDEEADDESDEVQEATSRKGKGKSRGAKSKRVNA